MGRSALAGFRKPFGFQRLGRGGFSPTTLVRPGDVAFLLDPATLPSLSQDDAGAMPITASGQTVGRAADLTGQGRHMTQATAGSRPTYTVGGDGKPYLSFDGVADFLSNASIAWGSDELTIVFAMRKNSATVAVAMSFSTDPTTNNGAFNLVAPVSAASHFATYIRGDAPNVAAMTAQTLDAAYDAPFTGVVAITGKIGNDTLDLIINGTVVASSTEDKGAGNFGTYPLYIGGNNAGLPCQMDIYGLFGINRKLSASDMASLEAWMQSKLGDNAVEDALAGSGGFALDATDLATMWTDAGKTAPVDSAADQIAVISSKLGPVSYDFTQGSASLRPTWSGAAADFDGPAGQHWISAAADVLLNNKPAAFFCGKVVVNDLSENRPVFALSTNAGASARFRLIVTTTGAVTIGVRRVDGGSQTVLSSAAGVVTAGVPCTLTFDCDYAGTGTIRVFKDDTQVITGTMVEAVGNTSATDSVNFYIGRNVSALEYMDGVISRAVFADKLMTAGQIAGIKAWANKGGVA